ncbi:MAG: hypothetical protein A4E71_00071 [Smithella sp. PtaU1.Bin162]|nr:MAG: hypothetical protein A4E71_00071 [Smithella sp. PtaU1.Bin162]
MHNIKYYKIFPIALIFIYGCVGIIPFGIELLHPGYFACAKYAKTLLIGSIPLVGSSYLIYLFMKLIEKVSDNVRNRETNPDSSLGCNTSSQIIGTLTENDLHILRNAKKYKVISISIMIFCSITIILYIPISLNQKYYVAECVRFERVLMAIPIIGIIMGYVMYVFAKFIDRLERL